MARGFLTGAVVGGVVSLGAAVVVSVIAPPPMPLELSDAAPGAAVAPDRVVQDSGGDTRRTTDTVPITDPDAPQTSSPDRDTFTVDIATTTTARPPETGGAAKLTAPEPVVDAEELVAAGDEPVAQSSRSAAPQKPDPADELSISTEPAQPPSPPVTDVTGAFEQPTPAGDNPSPKVTVETSGPQTPTAPETTAQTDLPSSDRVAAQGTAPEPDVAPAPAPAPAAQSDQITDAQVAPDPVTAIQFAPEPTTAPESGAAPELALVAKPDAPDTGTRQGPDSVPSAEQPAMTATDPGSTTATEALADPEETAPASPPVIAYVSPEISTPQADSESGVTRFAAEDTGRPLVGTPALTLSDRNAAVTVNRADTTAPAAVTVLDSAPQAPTDDTVVQPPLQRYAEPVAYPSGKPLMSIVLIDDGSSLTSGAIGLSALRSFPYPLTFAIDSSKTDAAAQMEIYRREGFEVLAIVDLPAGAEPTDAETTLAATLPRLPEAVGVLEGLQGGLQGSRQVADQVTAILGQSGHGLVTQDKGLNTMPRLARKNGVAAEPVFRDFDSKGQSATVIRRFLDQAAFKAGREGAVIMLGRLRPDTITALLQWGLQDRASQVALVPISAVLLRDQSRQDEIK